MKVIILGSGVIGVASAWYLAKAGHQVTVLERQSGPALETSFANAGELSYGYSSPWAAPGIPKKALKWLFMRHAPLVLNPVFDVATARWLTAMLRNCTPARYAVNKSRMVRVADYSRDQLRLLRDETGIEYDGRSQGTLELFRNQKQLDAIGKDLKVLEKDGVPFELLDVAGCVRAEPGLAHAEDSFVGGLRLPEDETGDCFKFTNALMALASKAGVDFRYGVDIRRLVMEGGHVAGVETSDGPNSTNLISGDRYVVALGSYSPALVRPLGLKLPVYPVKGYSLTMPITDESRAPVSTLMDEAYKVGITRLGDRVRIGGMAEIAGFDKSLPELRRQTLERSAGSLFPGAGDLKGAQFWTGLRPMTPDGTPIIGATGIDNLFLNTGHGTLGWTMGCASGRLIADIISGKTPEIDVSDLSIGRY